ncbi:putative nucleotidyltransferase, ribonuclease H, partial [Tanacetum coccineum]
PSLPLKSPVYHEPSVASVVSASVVDRSIGTDNPHLTFGSQVDRGAFNMLKILECFGMHSIYLRADVKANMLGPSGELDGTPTLPDGPELIEITNEKVAVAKEKLKEARSRQKSYADKHRRDLEFQVGDRVFLKVSPFRGVKRFGIKGKLSPRFIGPFEILERIGEVSYRLALPPQLSHVHDVFHVSLLRGYHYHPLHVASYPFDQIQPDMSLSEEPESILDRQERVMRNKVIPFVKILWKNHPEREATWETEESMRASYPHFFV